MYQYIYMSYLYIRNYLYIYIYGQFCKKWPIRPSGLILSFPKNFFLILMILSPNDDEVLRLTYPKLRPLISKIDGVRALQINYLWECVAVSG